MKKLLLLIIVFVILASSCKGDNKELNSDQFEAIQLFYCLVYDDSGEEKLLYSTDYTDRLVALLNYYAFDYVVEDEEESRFYEKLNRTFRRYDFDSDNRLTSEWILNNTYDAYEFSKDLPIDFISTILISISNDEDFDILGKVYGLTYDEYMEYWEGYKLFRIHINFKIDETRIVVDAFNNYFFSDNQPNSGTESFENALKTVQDYGFSKENLMTTNWVVKYPYEAYHLMKALPNSVREEIFTVPDNQ